MKEFYSSEKWQQMEWGHPGGAQSTQWLLEAADLQDSSHILDLCCGRGDAAEVILGDPFRQKRFKVTGVDESEAAIAEAQKRYGEKYGYGNEGAAGLCGRIQFLTGDARQIPLQKNAVDAVLCQCSLSLFGSGIPHVLGESVRVLRAGGCMMLSDMYSVNQQDKGMGGNHLYTEQEWNKCLAAAGFVLQEWKDISDELRAYCMEYLWKTGSIFPACAHGLRKGISLTGLGYFQGVWRKNEWI